MFQRNGVLICICTRFYHAGLKIKHILHTLMESDNMVEALHILWKSGTGVVAVRDRENNRLIRSLTNRDVYLLLECENLLHKKKSESM